MCCVFEGAARKWGVGDASIAGRLAYLSKDIVMALFLIAGAGRSSPLTNAAQPYVVVGLFLVGLGSAISAASGIEPVGAVLTIRTFFILPLAAWSAARLLPSDALRRFALWVVILALPISVLGIRQFYSPSSSVINRYTTVGEYVATSGVSQRVRATGTFSYISGFGEFATVAVWAAIVTLTLARTQRERLLGAAGLVAAFACAFVTVSRSVALTAVGLVAVWAFAGGKYGRKAQAALTVALVLFAIVIFTEQWNAAGEIATTVYTRHVTGRDTFAHRFWYNFIHPLDAIGNSPIGEGLGSQQVTKSLSENARRERAMFESAWGRVIMEIGVLGLIGFLMTLCLVLAPLSRAYRSTSRGEAATILAVTLAALSARALMGFQFNHVAAYFYWAMAAAALALANRPEPAPMAAPVLRSRPYSTLRASAPV